MRLYLDDIRLPLPGFKLIRTVNDLKSFVMEYAEEIEILDLDYDMGINESAGGSGLDFLKWLEEKVFCGEIKFKKDLKIICHSSNTEKRVEMEEIAKGVTAYLKIKF